MNASRFQDRKGRISIFGRTIVLAAVSLVMLLMWLSADPEAHEHFHHDADKGDHHCVVTEFAVGSGHYVVPAVVVPPIEAGFGLVHFSADEVIRETVDYVLLPICGPPSLGENA
jgi:hypothetical protein